MAVLVWLFIGFLSGVGVLYMVAWGEKKSSMDITPNVVIMISLGMVGGIFTTFLLLMAVITILSEDQRSQEWFSKPFKSIKIKKDKSDEL